MVEFFLKMQALILNPGRWALIVANLDLRVYGAMAALAAVSSAFNYDGVAFFVAVACIMWLHGRLTFAWHQTNEEPDVGMLGNRIAALVLIPVFMVCFFGSIIFPAGGEGFYPLGAYPLAVFFAALLARRDVIPGTTVVGPTTQ